VKAALISDPGELAPTRLSLLERLRNLDDHGSWQEFFDTYWRLIYFAAVRAGLSDADAEDVVQETIIGVARNMPKFRYEPEVCSFKGWLMRVTRSRIVDHLRKALPQKNVFVPLLSDTKTGEEEPLMLASHNGASFEELWDAEWQKNLIEAAMERVKRKVAPEHYQIFYLHSLKGMPARDVGELLGASVPKVYVVRHRVARLIKQEIRALEEKGGKTLVALTPQSGENAK
jgi:RNA polymerase sigma-70 factor (ECF subfamily)